MAKSKLHKRKVVVRRRDAQAWEKQEALRNTEIAYLTDPQQRSVEYWWDRLCVGLLPLQRCMIRARQGKWATRREEYWNEVTQEVLRQTKHRTVHDRVHELQQIQQLWTDMLEAVTPKIIGGRKVYPVKPGTMEGMVGALVKLGNTVDDRRDMILTMIEPELARDKKMEQGSVFSPADMRMVAKTLLQQVRERQRILLEEHTDGEKRGKSESEEDRIQSSGDSSVRSEKD